MKLINQGKKDAYLEWGSAWICLQERPEYLFQQQKQIGVDHVAFYILEGHFDSAVKSLNEQQVPIVRGPEKRGRGWSINFLDPDGTQLELHTSTLSERMNVWNKQH